MAIGLGGVLFVPSPASLALAAAGAVASAGVGLAVESQGWGVLTWPFNVVLLGTTYALGQRVVDWGPRRVVIAGWNPEETLRRDQTRRGRGLWPEASRLALPFRGAWTCTQGNDGDITHQGAWRHGLDFEIVGEDGERCVGGGLRAADWRCYGQPVLAAGPGMVVEVVDHVPDNAIGEIDTENPYGNLVIVAHAGGVYSLVAHLRPNTAQVRVGDVVRAGQVLGRCGNSGRSPVPHLHFQLQSSPIVGDATREVRFHGVVREEEGRALHREALPERGHRLANPGVDARLARAMAWPPGTRLGLEVDGGPRIEAISEVDAVGNRSLRDVATGDRLWFESRGGSFVVWDYEGPRRGALFVLSVALGVLPYDGGELRWRDRVHPARLTDGLWAGWAAWRGAFWPPALVTVAYTGGPDGDGYAARGEAEGLRCGAQIGPEGLREAWVELGGRREVVRCSRR